jgi:hypothetical protein
MLLWQKGCQTSQEQLLIREKGKASRGGLVRGGGNCNEFGFNIRVMGTQAPSGSTTKRTVRRSTAWKNQLFLFGFIPISMPVTFVTRTARWAVCPVNSA